MKVLHLLDSLNRGGAEGLVLDICRNAKSNDLDLIFAATGGGTLEADFENSGTEFIRLNRRLPIDFGVIANLRKIVKARQINIVHTHQAVEAVHAYLACLGTPTRIVLTHHGFIADKKNLLALRFLIPRVSMNIVVSRALVKWYETENKLKFPVSTRVLYNGVDEKRLRGKGRKIKQELGLAANTPLIGMIANFYRDPRKDQMTVCRALPKVFAEIGNAHFIFVGKVETGAEDKFQACLRFCAENGIADRVHFTGGRKDVADILDALDLFVFSSLQEGFGIAAAEAMLARVPTLLSDIEPFLEVSANGEYAEVFPVGNHEILSAKILKLLKDEKLREALENRAFNYARGNFSIEMHLRELIKLYRSIL